MKIGIISDIHGNVKALEAVLVELENKNIDKIICLGDFIGRSALLRRSNEKNNLNKR